MADNDKKEPAGPAVKESAEMSRRQFLTGVGGAGIGLVLGGVLVKGFLLPDEVFAVPASDGYLLVDTKKCSGCTTCMMACSLAHTGEVNLSLARIQVVQDSFGAFPNDIEIAQCRQCPYPACVDACPTGANHVDTKHGNVRTIDASKCIGCERCVEACPFTPSRVQWNFEEKHSQKCDLCADTPFWDEKGGPDGKRACETLCSMRAISFTREIPRQNEDGYNVDLRGPSWDAFGFSGAGGASGGH
ncbi:MAG: 4Fe-4S dicluster domain-containing protein [Actinomycetia bacterium]|nr:4Fe-4S dicluster domain-containing protein [Actinomycetes bacterium]